MFGSFAVESFINDKDEHTPFCLSFYYDEKFTYFYLNTFDNSDIILKSIFLISETITKRPEIIIYSHDLDFIGLFILDSLTKKKDLYFEIFSRDLRIYSIIVNIGDLKLIFRCSYKILPISLKSISENFNLPAQLPFPYKFVSSCNLFYKGTIPDSMYFDEIDDFLKLKDWMVEKNLNEFDFKQLSIDYCNRSSQIIKLFVELLKKLIKNFNINFSNIYSISSLSFKIFIQCFNNKKVKSNYSALLENFVRNSYFGGRCEVYGNPQKDEKIFYYDFSGMYGQCMLEKFPIGKFQILNNVSEICRPGFYWIEYESNLEIPVLPHHRFLDNKLMFANGVQSGCYWFEEIILFLEMGGRLISIKYAAVFDDYDFVFTDFVQYFNNIKPISYGHKIFAKLMINSLYGRMGMNQITEESFFIKKEEFDFYAKKLKIISLKELNNFCLISAEIDTNLKKLFKNKTFKKTKNNIALASAITAKGRIKLFKAQQSVIKNNGRLLYSDTDSIYAAYKRNVLGESHGEIYWDPNKKESLTKDAVFICPKSYAIIDYAGNEIIKLKGYSKKEISFYEIKTMFYENLNLKINNYKFIDKNNLIAKKKTIEKTYSFIYDKRKFSKDKRDTSAFLIKNLTYV